MKTANKLHSFSDRIEKVSSEIEEVSSTHIKEAFDTFQNASELQIQIVEKNKEYIQSLNHLSDSLKSMPNSLFTITEKASQVVKQIEDSSQSLQLVWENYEERFKNVDESAVQIFMKLKEGLGSIAKQSAGYIENLNKQTAQVSHSFAQAVEELKESVEDQKENIGELKESISKLNRNQEKQAG